MNDADDIVEKIDIVEMDFVFISYDEPRCEEHWSTIIRMIPWAKRIHGVKGFDAAHKAAANIAATDRLITIDGDSIPDVSILDKTLNIRAGIRNHVFSWRARNAINGLCYGNGSLKCWPRNTMLDMNTHESTSGETGAVDFCWSIPYTHLKRTTSTTYPNGSPYQAFRSGFREGIKMVLNRGVQIPPDQFLTTIWDGSIRRLQIWSGVGADVENGLWAIYGARCGLDMMMDYPNPSFSKIADYEWFVDHFRTRIDAIRGYYRDIHGKILVDQERLFEVCRKLSTRIRNRSGIELALYDEDQSRVMKNLIEQPFHGPDLMVEE